LAHGLAVVATPVGAHAEVIEPERSGLLVPPGDIAALSAALTRVIADKALRERLRGGARQRFLDRFDVRSYSTRLARLHAELLRGREVQAGMGIAARQDWGDRRTEAAEQQGLDCGPRDRRF
jgi:glycosyltransferase involved in cell wall biosynthesis